MMAVQAETPGLPAKPMITRTLSTDTLDDYGLQHLYDPENYDHLTIPEQLALYKKRDLKKIKFYKTAAQIFGAPRTRKRVIVAPPMNTGQRKDGSSTTMTSELKESKSILDNMNMGDQERCYYEEQLADFKKWVAKRNEDAKQIDPDINVYKKDTWLEERKKFREKINSMGLTEDWLESKPEKTAAEMRVLEKMKEASQQRPLTPVVEEKQKKCFMKDVMPVVKYPCPPAVKEIEKYLQKHRIRLIDLFLSVDRNKDWKVTREEFREAFKKAGIEIPDVQVEDLILALDVNFADALDYRELAKGMNLWKLEKRESKKKTILYSSTDYDGNLDSPTKGSSAPARRHRLSSPDHRGQGTPTLSRSQSEIVHKETEHPPTRVSIRTPDSTAENKRIKSALSTISSGSSFLEVPEPDLRKDQFILESEEAMVDLRKRDKAVLERYERSKKAAQCRKKGLKVAPKDEIPDHPRMIATQNRAIDDHMALSTMTGETAVQVNKFRQLVLRDYLEISRLCKKNHINFSEELLSKALLFPGDRPRKQIKGDICQPASELLSYRFPLMMERKGFGYVPISESSSKDKSPSSSARNDDSDTGGMSKRGSKHHIFPSRDRQRKSKVLHLPEGKKVVRSKVDNWLTFEEFEKLTKSLSKKYRELHGRTQANSFWPGHLLDKVRLLMPDNDPNVKTNALFQNTKTPMRCNHGYENDLRIWPENERGYLQTGIHDPYENKYI